LKCLQCGSESPEGSRYCSECYHPLPAQVSPPGTQVPPPGTRAPGISFTQPATPAAPGDVFAQTTPPPVAPGDAFAQPPATAPVTPDDGMWNEAAPPLGGDGAVIAGFVGARGAQGGGNIPGMPPAYGGGGGGGAYGGGPGGPFEAGPITPTPTGPGGAPPSVETLANPGYWQSALKAGGGSGWGYGGLGGMSVGARLVMVLVILIVFGSIGAVLATSYHSPSSYLPKYTTPSTSNYNYPSGHSYSYSPYSRTPTSPSTNLSNVLNIVSVTPNSASAGSIVSLEVKGSGFQSGATAELSNTRQEKTPGSAVMVYGVDRLTCQFNLQDVASGSYYLTIKTLDGQASSSSFTVR
jgi:hypothetical protein